MTETRHARLTADAIAIATAEIAALSTRLARFLSATSATVRARRLIVELADGLRAFTTNASSAHALVRSRAGPVATTERARMRIALVIGGAGRGERSLVERDLHRARL
jgi:hypothetical protein